jgi:oxysterol 7-alpha-hydroxylase
MFGDRFPAEIIFSSNQDFEDQFGVRLLVFIGLTRAFTLIYAFHQLMYAGLPFPWLVRRGTRGRDRCIALVKSSLGQYESGEAQPPYFIQVMMDLRHTLGWSSQDLAAYLYVHLFLFLCE